MKKLLLFLIVVTSALCPLTSAIAQEVHPVSGEPLKYCGQTTALKNLYLNNPGLQAEVELLEIESQKNLKKNHKISN